MRNRFSREFSKFQENKNELAKNLQTRINTGARDRTRTGTPLPILDFKSKASANSATRANQVLSCYGSRELLKRNRENC